MRWAPLAILLLAGCTVFRVEQRDETPGDRIITTKLYGTAWFSSAQAIAKIKATTTDKSQTFGTESLGQQGSTNSVEALKSIARILELLRPIP